MAYKHVRYNKNGSKTITRGRRNVFGGYSADTYTINAPKRKTQAEIETERIAKLTKQYSTFKKAKFNLSGTRQWMLFTFDIFAIAISLIALMFGLFMILPIWIIGRLLTHKFIVNRYYDIELPNIIQRDKEFMSTEVYNELIKWNSEKIVKRANNTLYRKFKKAYSK